MALPQKKDDIEAFRLSQLLGALAFLSFWALIVAAMVAPTQPWGETRYLTLCIGVVALVASVARSWNWRAPGSADASMVGLRDVANIVEYDLGDLELESRTFNVIELIDRCVEVAISQAAARNIRLIVDIDPGMLDVVVGDESRIHNVLLHLLAEVAALTDRGEIELRAIGSSSGSAARLRFEVRGTRAGAAHRLDVSLKLPEHLEAREPGWRALVVSESGWRRRTLTAYARSAGGDAVAVDGDEAVMAARRAPGVFEAVVVDGEPPPGLFDLLGDGVRQISMDSLGDPPRLSRVRGCMSDRQLTSPAALRETEGLYLDVLLIDDNKMNRMVARRVLARLGCRVVEAESGEEAVRAVRCAVPDVVLMDCEMPGMNGLEAAAEIRKLPGEAGRVPIVALTAHSLVMEERRCRDAGMDEFLTKPFRPDDLKAVLLRCAGQRGGVATVA